MSAPITERKSRSRPTVHAMAVLLAVVAAGGVAQPAAAEPPATEAGAFATEGPQPESDAAVTLITGDRVVFDPANPRSEPRITPGEGRGDLDFHTLSHEGHLYVIPSDAQPLIDEGLLDRRLFDVAGLFAIGYDDAHTDAVPLLFTGGSVGIAAETVAGTDIETASVPKAETAETWESLTDGDEPRTLAAGVSGVWLDGVRELQLDASVPQIGAPQAWEAGFTGAGVTVAVLDSGVDAAHPDLSNIVEARDFTDSGDTGDAIGHGTHVASTISGSGTVGGVSYKGVAPDADLLIGKVCVDDVCPESAILAGMQWAAESGADIVNLSLSGPDTPELDPIEQALDDLSAQYGTLFVVAAGNEGNGEPVGSPGSADASLTVGAVDGQDELAEFSNTGRAWDSGLKPDLTAPGVDITAARAADTWAGEPIDDHYASMSGTSMAAPHVAGAAALLLQQHPDWTGEQIKAALMASAAPNDAYSAFEQGAGRVDAAQALDQRVHTSPASVSFGLMEWPHEDDAPATETVTYHNTGDAAVTLALGLNVRGPDGSAAPEGLFSLDRTSVTVPPGGEAAVGLTVDTTVEASDGRYSAYLTATGDGAEVTTPVAVDKEPERYDLTVEAFGREGEAVDFGSGALLDLNTGVVERFAFEDGAPATLRVPPGNYHVDATFRFGEGGAHMIQPLLEITDDTAVSLDAREAGQLDIGFDNDDVVPVSVSEQYARTWADGVAGMGVTLGSLDHFYMGGIGEAVPEDELTIAIDGAWGIPDAAGDFSDSPVMYQPVILEHGQMPAGLERHFADEDMARVEAEYRENTVADEIRLKSWIVSLPGGWNLYATMPLASGPVNRTEFLSVLPEGQWRSDYFEAKLDVPEGEAWPQYFVLGSWSDYEAGQTYAEAWDAAVIGPGLPADRDLAFAERFEDQIGVNVPLFADAHPGRWGRSVTDASRTALYADGELVGETEDEGGGFFDVPAEAADFRLETEADRGTYAELSTEVRATWEFASAHTEDVTALPLMAVKFTPEGLDEANAADDRRTAIDLRVETQNGPVEDVDLELEVSFDDGETWKAVAVCDLSAAVFHPKGAGYVSLRVTADDGKGNSVTQEIIHAYRYR
ncbi:S8 family serine peptidase [Glycomyces tritici]|uniref:S8 family serine peptidase n=1 Tax=Glycomyces tritici TaxID=2665176 RepID=A0ABT7YYE1_9ACTN|nr:S8 family serine peptidase [Glycomyces tritici]MDN3242106.1 S8 family serine peptidase [Glycomyces tritici]MDN3243670.1 S8 family serine peptidase [Glycomyces tritici]